MYDILPSRAKCSAITVATTRTDTIATAYRGLRRHQEHLYSQQHSYISAERCGQCNSVVFGIVSVGAHV